MPTTISVKIKSEDVSFKQDFLVYSPIEISHESADLKRLIDQAVANFKGKPENIIIKANFIWE